MPYYKVFPGLSCLGFFIFGIVISGISSAQEIKSLLPDPKQISEWKIADSARIYHGDDLFQLIDGGADLYLEYGFNEVVTSRYENDSKATLQVEIYKMTSDTAAFGIFSTMLSDKGKPIDIGNDSRIFDYYLVFWKGNYFVTVTGSDQLNGTKKSLEQVGSIIGNRIREKGNIPLWLTILPSAGLIERKYIKGNIGLSNIYSFGINTVFDCNDIVYAKYNKVRIFDFRYKSEQIAKNQFSLICKEMSGSSQFRNFKLQNGGFKGIDNLKNNVFIKLKDNYIQVYLYTDRSEFNKLSKQLF